MSTEIQKVTPGIIVDAFDFMGGDPTTAIQRAKNFSRVASWTAWQATQSAAVGAVAVAVPVAHVPLIVADVAFLLHKMAYCCWGIGAIHNCPIESKEDFAVILGLYTHVVTEHALIAGVGTGTIAVVGGAIASAGLPAFIGKSTGKTASFAAKSIAKGTSKALAKAVGAGAPLVGHVSGKLAEKISAKVGAKIAAKGFAKSATNFFSGFAPVLGAVAAGGVNVYFVAGMAKSADRYYKIKREYAKH